MSKIDWILFAGFLAFVVWDGVRRGRKTDDASDYFLAGRSMPWWVMGLSIMATQASAITMIGTTGQGWKEGLKFLQFYFALPLAMIILCFTAVPLFHKFRVSTAYEYLGIRFDAKTRVLAAILFLINRGLALGFVIYAPSVAISAVFGVRQDMCVVMLGVVALVYTSFGGLRAVLATDVKQITVMFLGLVLSLVVLIYKLPSEVGLGGAWQIALESGYLEWVTLEWDPSQKYTLPSSLLGGLFLFLSYFGTDQSQVQRYLAGKSVRHNQGALLLNAALKVPFQFLVLFVGVLLFVFFMFEQPPSSFDPRASAQRDASHLAAAAKLEESWNRTREAAQRFLAAEGAAAEAAADELRTETQHYRETRAAAQPTQETHFVFPHFILNYLPIGLVGLLLAAIIAAALSSIDSELNSMTTVAVVDIYQFALQKELSSRALVRVSRLATVVLAIYATSFALFASQLQGSLIEGVNRVGSYLYGSLLGVFLLAFFVPKARGTAAFVGMLAGMLAVGVASESQSLGLSENGVAFLYLNTIGTTTVLVVGGAWTALSGIARSSASSEEPPATP